MINNKSPGLRDFLFYKGITTKTIHIWLKNLSTNGGYPIYYPSTPKSCDFTGSCWSLP